VTSFLGALCGSTAAKPMEEQKSDESPERLPQAKVPPAVSPSAAKGRDLIPRLMGQSCD